MRMRIQQSGLHRSTVSVNHAGSCKHRTQINCKRMPVRTLRQAALFPIMETKQAVPHKTNWGKNSLTGFGGNPMSWYLLTAFCVMNDTDCRAWLKGIDTPCTLDARLARSLLWRNECKGKICRAFVLTAILHRFQTPLEFFAQKYRTDAIITRL